MAVDITRGKKNYEEHASRYSAALTKLESQRTILLELVEADAAAYRKVMEAYKLPKDSPARETAVQQALVHATDVPSRTANAAAEALAVLRDLQDIIHPNVASDLQVGLQMLRSAIQGGIANMRINIKDIKDGAVRERYEEMAANYAKSAN